METNTTSFIMKTGAVGGGKDLWVISPLFSVSVGTTVGPGNIRPGCMDPETLGYTVRRRVFFYADRKDGRRSM